MVYVIVGIVCSLIVYVIMCYTNLVKLHNIAKEQWLQIDVYLKRRANLILNLVDIVKGYAKNETDIFESTIEVKDKILNAKNEREELEANKDLSIAISKVFSLADGYLELKSNTNFLDLQNNLKEIEDKISYARGFYNDSVLKYKNKLDIFPTNIISKILEFETMPFFEVADNEH